MNKLRVGIVGTGIMGGAHAKVYRTHPQCELIAASDLQRSRAASFAEEFGIPHVFDSHTKMLSGVDLDLISVCTPDFAHAVPAIDAANAGKHVLVEKPLATSVEDAEAIIAAAQRNRVKVMTQFSHRWATPYRHTKDLLQTGELGEPVMAYARKNDTLNVATDMIGWADKSTPSWFLSSHDIDLVCWYFETEPEEVYANAVWKVLVRRGINTPDAAQAQVRFTNGAIGTFEACWIYPNTYPTTTDSFIEVITTGSVIHLDRKCEQIEVSTEKSYRYPRHSMSYIYEDGELHGAVGLSVRHFIKCVLEDREPLVTLDSSLRVTRILDAIQKSIDQGGPIRL
jgi:predicted dehydrogenase